MKALRLVLVTLAGLCALAKPAVAAESIVLMPLELSSGLEGSRADLEAAVIKGLAVAGRPVVPPAESASARGTYLVSGSVGREGTTFNVRFRLVRASDGQETTQENHCDMVDCSVAELARRSARELVRQTLSRPGEEPAPPEPAPPKPPAPSPDSGSPGMGRLGVGAIAAGVAAIGAGIWLVTIDGKCSTSPASGSMCKDLNNTRTGGIASIVGGVAAGALGVYLLVRDDGPAGTSVAVGVRPSGLVVAGRF